MIKVLGIANFIRLLLPVCMEKRAMEQAKSDETKDLDQETCIYTEDYDGVPVEDRRSDREYCKMAEKYFKMFTMLSRRPEPYMYQCEKGKRVVELRYLYDSRKRQIRRTGISMLIKNVIQFFRNKRPSSERSRNRGPRRWLDYVIFYSLKKRSVKMESDVFLGVAIYAQYYGVDGKHEEILLDNLLNLYIREAILDASRGVFEWNILRYTKRMLLGAEDSFYSRIYMVDANNHRAELEMSLLERMMKNTLLMVLRILKIPFSVEKGYLKMHVHGSYRIEEWFEKRSNRLVENSEFITFSNVMMERVPAYHINDADRIIILALIGVIRTGRHVISVKCEGWLENGDFSSILDLVSTNRNLIGVTELNTSMNLDKKLGRIKNQLEYLEVNFDYPFSYNNAITFINSLDGISMSVSLYNFHSASLIKALLASPKVKYVFNFQVPGVLGHLGDLGELGMLKSIVSDEKLIDLELYDCDMTLEEFLAGDDFKALRAKLRVLEVTNVGDLHNEKITDADLRDLKMERLCINTRCGNKIMGVDQLLNRGIITRKGFKYLVFKNIHPKNAHEIISLQNHLGAREWPVIITDFKPALGRENADCAYIRHPYFYYELRTN